MKKFFLFLFASTLLMACGDQNANQQENQESTDEASTELQQDQVSVKGTIQMSPADLWADISSFSGLEKVFPEVFSSTTVEGEGVGAKRTLVLADGSGETKEELTKLDAENRILEYKIISSPLPISDYVGTMQITQDEENENNATLQWSSSYNVKKESADEMKKQISGFYQTGIANWNKIALASAEKLEKEEE